MHRSVLLVLACSLIAALASSRTAAEENPYAAEVISYAPGSGVGDYNNPFVAIGEPTRFTGANIFPAVVSAFNAPWIETEIVSIGPGGHLTIRFETPVVDHPDHPFGIDLLIFGNTMFLDAAWPEGIVGGTFGDDGGIVEVSEDGVIWHVVPNVQADGLFPTIGYLDAGPYDTTPGEEETDFTLPVDPSLTLDDFLGLDNDGVLALYNGSGGGAGVDIASVGLAQVSYVRVSNPPDAFVTVDIDAFAKVSPVPPGIPGDLNGDGSVGVADLLILLANWGPCADCADCPADLNGDCNVGVGDLLILLANWG